MKIQICLVIFGIIASAQSLDKDPRCPQCEDETSIAVHLPHESDCTKFYQCSNGYAILMECPPGLHFNADLQVCDWPCDAGCENSGSEETDEPEIPETTPGPEVTEETTPDSEVTEETVPEPTVLF